MASDVIFLVDGSQRSIANFTKHKARFLHIRKLVTTKVGIEAYKEAASMSKTSSFFVVDHLFQIVDSFMFDYKPEPFDKNYTHSWRHEIVEGNPSTDIIPGYNGVHLFNRNDIRISVDVNTAGNGVKRINEIASKELHLDIIVMSYKNPQADRNQSIIDSCVGHTKRIDCDNIVDGCRLAASIAETENFFVVDVDFIPTDMSVFDFKPHDYDANSVHVWHCNNSDYSGIRMFNKSMFDDASDDFDGADFMFGYGSLKTKWIEKTVAKKDPQPFDIVFISYDEPNAEENWSNLKSRFPYAKRVHKVDGIFNAHKKASELSVTNNFYVVDGDSEINSSFKFDIELSENEANHYVYIWKCLNPINGLIYGYGGIKLFSKKMFDAMDEDLVDMSTILGDGVKLIDEVASITRFDTSGFHAFRAAFRECTKLASGIIKNQIDEETKKRLDIWCSFAEGKYADDALLGAKIGREYGQQYANDITKLQCINDYELIAKKYKELK